jgi:prepilin-type N-terminal cleavage/methylation domain-containing protein
MKLGITLRKIAGFSVIELMVGMTIFSVGMTGLAAMSTVATKANKSSAYTTKATILAQDRIEMLKGLSFTALDSASKTEGYGSMQQMPGFKRVTTISTKFGGDANITQATVTVYWRNDQRQTSLTTLINRAR